MARNRARTFVHLNRALDIQLVTLAALIEEASDRERGPLDAALDAALELGRALRACEGPLPVLLELGAGEDLEPRRKPEAL